MTDKPDAKTCPKCGAEPRRQAYPTGTEPPIEWLCGSYLHHGDVVVLKGEFCQSEQCQLASLTAQLAEAKAERDRMQRMFRDGFDAERVMAWQKESPPRSPADAFTAGGERSAAYLIDDERREWSRLLAAESAARIQAEKERDSAVRLRNERDDAELRCAAAEQELKRVREELQNYRKVRAESFGPFNPSKSHKMRECAAWSKVLALLATPQGKEREDER